MFPNIRDEMFDESNKIDVYECIFIKLCVYVCF